MIKPFKLFNGYTYSDEYTLPLSPDPPFGISRRHWNMMPQDLRGATLQEMECYIQGWEASARADYNNPYHDMIRGELWNRGWHAWSWRQTRTGQNFNNVNPNPPIDETYPEFYNTDELIFFDVTEERLGMLDGEPYKVMLFRHIEEGNTIEGDTIYPEHPMYNFPDVI
jgi:hypothetical protein